MMLSFHSLCPTVGGQPRCFCEYPELGVSINGSTPIAGWFIMEHPSINKWMIWGYPPLWKPPIEKSARHEQQNKDDDLET
jgi:hypothetical protein